MRYPQLFEGEGLELKPLGRSRKKWQILRLACCDCGLIHEFAFAIEANGNLGIAVRRDNRATGAYRRGKAFRCALLPKDGKTKG